jgi:hypothetical protein
MSHATIEAAQTEAARIKAYFPFRVVFISKDEQGLFEVGSGKTRARALGLAKKGREVWIFG